MCAHTRVRMRAHLHTLTLTVASNYAPSLRGSTWTAPLFHHLPKSQVFFHQASYLRLEGISQSWSGWGITMVAITFLVS